MMQQLKLPPYAPQRQTPKRRKARFVKVQFALSDVENAKLQRIADMQALSRNKLIKLAIREYAARHPLSQVPPVDAGQLDMFRDPLSIQTAIPID